MINNIKNIFKNLKKLCLGKIYKIYSNKNKFYKLKVINQIYLLKKLIKIFKLNKMTDKMMYFSVFDNIYHQKLLFINFIKVILYIFIRYKIKYIYKINILEISFFQKNYKNYMII